MRALRAAALVAVLAAVGCPPPPDIETVTATRQAPASGTPKAPSTGDADPAPQPVSSQPGEPAPPGEPAAPAPGPGARPTHYERLAGGVFVPRCPACGTVQPAMSRRCVACAQELRPWRQEQACDVCAAEGRCLRCGDDRACLDCDGQGACPFCAGSGSLDGAKCPECNGSARCASCQGDGRRESAGKDFLPAETALPGACPTCVDGSGLCPECGTATKDASGADCVTCGGTGLCFDCGGSGACAHDAGDGLCLVCGGGGREVADGEPRKPSERVWTLRSASGTPIVGRVIARPEPNVHVQPPQDAPGARTAFTRSQLHPLSYYLALRDFTDPANGRQCMELGTVALSSGFWPLALRDFRRAMAADPTLASECSAQLREVTDRRTIAWLETAEKARKAGDREGASHLLDLVRFVARGSPQATRADVLRLQIQRERDEEASGLDAAARERIAAEDRARAERACAGARRRLDRARSLLAAAQRAPTDDPAVEGTAARADAAAWAAARLVQREARRRPASSVPWPAKPESLLREARALRTEAALWRAGREIAAGRFDFGARLARRAAALDAANAQAPRLVEQAELGLARRGVLRASPPPLDGK